MTNAEFTEKQINVCMFIIEKANREIIDINFQLSILKKQLREQKNIIKEANEEIKWRSE